MNRCIAAVAAIVLLGGMAEKVRADNIIAGPSASTFATYGNFDGDESFYGLVFTASDASTLRGFTFYHDTQPLGWVGSITLTDITNTSNPVQIGTVPYSYAGSTAPSSTTFSGLNWALISGHRYTLFGTTTAPSGYSDNEFVYMLYTGLSFPLSNVDISVIGSADSSGSSNPANPNVVTYVWDSFTNLDTTSGVAAPQPSSLALLGVACACMVIYRLRRRQLGLA